MPKTEEDQLPEKPFDVAGLMVFVIVIWVLFALLVRI
jgi:hypothetical protein